MAILALTGLACKMLGDDPTMKQSLVSISITAAFAALLALGNGCSSSDSKQCELAPYQDPAPHQAGFVTVADGVSLHYLDFGGTGETLLFLAGLGDSAHVFDEFAPRFVDTYRVLALTRRGFGESSQPATGYDIATMANDIAVFLTAMGVDRAYVAGHSIAGAEMTRLAVDHPERVIKLVYLDAAYDWAASTAMPNPPPAPSQPQPTFAQLASPDALAGYVAWISGVPNFPLGDIRATTIFDCSGHYAGSRTSNAIVSNFATQAAAQHPDYAGVTVPALAIYTVPESESDLFPWLTQDSSQWPVATAFLPFAQAASASQRSSFAAALPSAVIVEMPSVPHFLFLAQPEAVEGSMRAFLIAP